MCSIATCLFLIRSFYYTCAWRYINNYNNNTQTWEGDTWSPTKKPTSWSKPSRKPTWNEWSPTRKPTRKPTSWSKPTHKPAWKSGGSNNNDGNKYRIYTKQGNPVGYNEDGWDNHFWWKDIIEDVRGECAAMLYEDVKCCKGYPAVLP